MTVSSANSTNSAPRSGNTEVEATGAATSAPPRILPGQRVRVTQQLPQGSKDVWTTTVEGTVVAYQQRKTGSWFAHSKDDRLWLDRLEIRRDDGEIVVANLDRFSRVEVLATAGDDSSLAVTGAETAEPAGASSANQNPTPNPDVR